MAQLVSVRKFDSPNHQWGESRPLETATSDAVKLSSMSGNLWVPGASPSKKGNDGNLAGVVVQQNAGSGRCTTPVTLAWKDIKLGTKEGKLILKGVSGRVNTGELTAIMGPSGAGKSSLLNVLSGFIRHKVTGRILVNGADRNMHVFRKLTCYIMQDDHLLPNLSVKESISVAAALKLPSSVSNKERQQAVQDVMKSLGLQEVQDNKACNISGGQRKRLCIAQEIVSNPPVIFLDEPTSGLDSSSCLQCIKLLKSLANEGRTIVCTIHQPSARIFEIFDKLIMLADGHCIYRGLTTGLVPFFAEQGLSCPQYHNPTDYAMEVAMGEHGEWNWKLKKAVDCIGVEDDSLVESPTHTSSKLETTLQASTLCLIQDKVKTSMSSEADLEESYSGYATSSWNQFKVITHRSITCSIREPMATQLRLFAHIIVGILLGVLYFRAGNDASKIFNNSGFLFFSLLFLIFTAMMPTVLTFPLEKTIVLREHLNSWYSTKMYYLAKTVAEIPFQIAFPVIYGSIVYWMTSQPSDLLRFGLFLASSIMISLIAQSLSLVIGACCSVQNAVFLAPVVTIPILLFCGFFINLDAMPPYLKWLAYVSYIRYSFQSVLLAVYGMDRPELECEKLFCPFSEPMDFLKEMAMDKGDLRIDYAVQIAFFLIFRIMAYFALKRKLKSSR